MTSLQNPPAVGQPKRPLVLVEPNPRVKLGRGKWLKISRGQDLVESIGWLSLLWVIFTFLIDGGLAAITDLHSALSAIDRLSALVATDASEDAGVLTVVDLNNSNYRAVATSGTAERGEHIWNPKTNGWANQLAQVTVVAEDLVSADVWATALFAAGDQALALAEKHSLNALFVDLDGELSSTKSFTELLRPV